MFQFFIGLDQTGAVGPKPLPFAFVDAREPTARLRACALDGKPLKLPRFSRDAIEALLSENAVEQAHALIRSKTTAILADAVFGLPSEVWPPASAGASWLRELFKKAAAHDGGFGLKPAASFFASLLNDQSGFPVRECERIAKANSVFRTHPYQKNIQCGTYRFWRELGLYGSEWIHLRYFERNVLERPMLFEAYPSLFWREMLGLNTRDRTKLIEKLSAHIDITNEDRALIERDADHADAAVLAVGGWWLQNKNALIDGGRSRDLTLAREGWIVGLPRKPRVTPRSL